MEKGTKYRSIAGISKCLAVTIIILASAASSGAVVINPFAAVIGKWRGSGIMTMKDGTKERIACDADHSGNSLQLRLIIHCVSGERDIRMIARLSSNAGRLLGFWEEKYFKAAGAISGIATENKISFTVSGNVNGRMIVTYTKNRQNVTITTKNVTLQKLKISMRRR
jgi:hypothetical protein